MKQLDRLLKEMKPEERLLLLKRLADEELKSAQEDTGEKRKLKVLPMMDLWSEAKKRMRVTGVISGLSTGMYSLDNLTLGLDEEELIVLTGETAQGKTNLALNIVYNLALEGVASAIFTMEMSNVEVVQRFIGFSKGDDSVCTLPIFYYADKADVDTSVIRDVICQEVQEHDVKLVVVDHLHYFARTADNQREFLEVTVRELKQIAREFKVPLILIAHTRKLQGGQDRPTMRDIKDTSAVAQDADQVIIVWTNREEFMLNFEVAKNRLKGKVGLGSMFINNNFQLIDEKNRLR